MLDYKFKHLFIEFISFNLIIPHSNLTHVSQFKDKVQIVMLIIINHLKKLCDIRMIKLRPNLNFSNNLIHIVYHMHFSFGIVPNSSFSSQCRFMHDFHGKFSSFTFFFLCIILKSLAILWLTDRASNDFFNFTKTATTNRLKNLKLIHKPHFINLLNLNLISKIHTIRLFKEFFVRYLHII